MTESRDNMRLSSFFFSFFRTSKQEKEPGCHLHREHMETVSFQERERGHNRVG